MLFPSSGCSEAAETGTEVRLKDVSTGTRWVHRGRGLLFLVPHLGSFGHTA